MRIITLFAALLLTGSLCAEHLPGGNITYECLSGNQYRITLHLWRECSGSPIIPQDLAFANDCGVSFELTDLDPVSVEDASPVCADEVGQTTCNGGSLIGIELYTYETTLFLSPCDHWTISWSTCCRAASVNLVLTQGTYIEAILDNSSGDCIDSPTFSQDRVPFACVGQSVSYDLGVAGGTAADVRFRLIGARRNTSLVEPVLYEDPYTGEEPYTGMEIDSLNGNITFTPMEQGYVVVVVEVSMYDDEGNWIGSVMRDFPFVVQACSNNVPDAASGTVSIAQGAATATGAYAATTCNGSPFCMEMEIVDIDPGQELTLTSNASINLPGATIQFSGINPVLATLCWDPAGAPVGVYTFTIYAQDDACPVFGTQTFAYSVAVAADGGDAGADATVPLCLETSVNLSDYLTGDPGGVWSAGPVVGASGIYTYTVATSCGSDVATFTVEDAPSPDAGDDASGDLCAGSTLDLNTLVNGDDGGSWSSGSPIVDLGGMYTYTVTNLCGSDIAEFIVFQFDPPNAGEDVEIDVCPNAPPFLLMDSLGGAPEPGGVWLYLGVEHSPTLDPAVDPQGNYCYTLTGEPPCTISQACVRVTMLPPTDPYCISLGIATSNRSGLSVMPNPSHGLFQVQGSESLRSLELTDAQGRLVWSTSSLVGQPTVSIVLPGSLADGMYLLRAQDALGTWSVQRVELLR